MAADHSGVLFHWKHVKEDSTATECSSIAFSPESSVGHIIRSVLDTLSMSDRVGVVIGDFLFDSIDVPNTTLQDLGFKECQEAPLYTFSHRFLGRGTDPRGAACPTVACGVRCTQM